MSHLRGARRRRRRARARRVLAQQMRRAFQYEHDLAVLRDWFDPRAKIERAVREHLEHGLLPFVGKIVESMDVLKVAVGDAIMQVDLAMKRFVPVETIQLNITIKEDDDAGA